MEYIPNEEYNDVFLEAQTNYVTEDPYGERFNIWQGMQFRFVGLKETESVCRGCGGKVSIVRTFIIDSFAVCPEGEYLWPNGETGLTIEVPGNTFIETRTLKYPPIVNDFPTELSGKDTDLFTHPKDRTIPREGGLWYVDPWLSNRTK